MSRQLEVIIRCPGQPERRIILGEGTSRIGRAEDSELVLSDAGVSRNHARISIKDRGAFIEDMGSGNGTFFQGKRVQRQELHDGDEVLIDPFILRFRVHEVGDDKDGITAELEEVDDDDTVRVSLRSTPAQETEERPALSAPLGQLVTIRGQRLRELYTIEGSLTLGRSEGRGVILFDPAASRNHALIEYVGHNFWLRDDGSANGTFVNSSRVREQCLRDGDRVRIGGTEFRFEIHTPAAAAGWVQEQETRVRGMERPAPLPIPAAVVAASAEPRPPLGPVQLAIIAAVGGFLVVAMMLLGGFVTLQLMDSEPAPATSESGSMAELDPEVVERVVQLMERGSVHFEAGRYLDAASQFYSVLKLAPGHAEAERQGYIACELLMVETLRSALVLRNLSDEAKESRRKAAKREARLALRAVRDARKATKQWRSAGSEASRALASAQLRLERAWLDLREVSVFSSDDAQLQELLQVVDTLRASGG
jgi:pSer/pThr/pTyr-binding forkhead associated (FHA) protein